MGLGFSVQGRANFAPRGGRGAFDFVNRVGTPLLYPYLPHPRCPSGYTACKLQFADAAMLRHTPQGVATACRPACRPGRAAPLYTSAPADRQERAGLGGATAVPRDAVGVRARRLREPRLRAAPRRVRLCAAAGVAASKHRQRRDGPVEGRESGVCGV